MSKANNSIQVAEEKIINKIYLLRGKKVMLDRDLAELYLVETKVLNQAVKRNLKRFPEDFMFQLTAEELENWRSQYVTSNKLENGTSQAANGFYRAGSCNAFGCITK